MAHGTPYETKHTVSSEEPLLCHVATLPPLKLIFLGTDLCVPGIG